MKGWPHLGDHIVFALEPPFHVSVISRSPRIRTSAAGTWVGVDEDDTLHTFDLWPFSGPDLDTRALLGMVYEFRIGADGTTTKINLRLPDSYIERGVTRIDIELTRTEDPEFVLVPRIDVME